MGTIASIILHFQLIPLAFDIIARFENSHNLLYFKKKKMEVGRETLRVNRCGLTKPPSCVFMCYASSFCNLSFLQTLLLRQKRVIKTGRVKVTN